MSNIINLADYREIKEKELKNKQNQESLLGSFVAGVLNLLTDPDEKSYFTDVLSNFEKNSTKVMTEGTIESLKESIIEYPQYMTDRIVISLYYYIFNKEEGWQDAGVLMSWVESYIVGQDVPINIDCLLDFVDDGYKWIDLSNDEQKYIVGKNIRKKLFDK